MSHTCHAHACLIEVPPVRFCCPKHWYSLRRVMQDAVWREYKPGQENRKDPTARYMAVQQRAVAEIALYRPKTKSGIMKVQKDLGFEGVLADGIMGPHTIAKLAEIAEPYLVNSRKWRRVAIERGEGDPLSFLEEAA